MRKYASLLLVAATSTWSLAGQGARQNGELLVPGLENEVKSATLLANGEELEFEKTPAGVLIEVSDQSLDPNATVIKVEIVGTPKVAKVFIKPSEDGSIELPAAMVDFPAPAKGASPRLQEGEAGYEIGFWENPEADSAGKA